MKKNWKQILAPLLVFALGALVGAGGTTLFALHRLREVMQADITHQRQLTGEFLSRRLRLDDEQRVQAQPVFEQLSRDLLAVRRGVQPQVRQAVDDAANRLRPILRPRQERRLDELLARARVRWDRIEREGEPSPAP